MSDIHLDPGYHNCNFRMNREDHGGGCIVDTCKITGEAVFPRDGIGCKDFKPDMSHITKTDIINNAFGRRNNHGTETNTNP